MKSDFANPIVQLESVCITLVMTVHAGTSNYYMPTGILPPCDYVKKFRVHMVPSFLKNGAPFFKQKMDAQCFRITMKPYELRHLRYSLIY